MASRSAFPNATLIFSVLEKEVHQQGLVFDLTSEVTVHGGILLPVNVPFRMMAVSILTNSRPFASCKLRCRRRRRLLRNRLSHIRFVFASTGCDGQSGSRDGK